MHLVLASYSSFPHQRPASCPSLSKRASGGAVRVFSVTTYYEYPGTELSDRSTSIFRQKRCIPVSGAGHRVNLWRKQTLLLFTRPVRYTTPPSTRK